jgi:uncharacterized protein YggT (Ycf19 family)
MPELVALTDPTAALELDRPESPPLPPAPPQKKRSNGVAFFRLVESLSLLAVEIAAVSLVVRVALRALWASDRSGFVAWVGRLTDPLVAPFRGVLPDVTLLESYRVDSNALLALGAYLLAWLVLQQLLSRLTGRLDDPERKA